MFRGTFEAVLERRFSQIEQIFADKTLDLINVINADVIVFKECVSFRSEARNLFLHSILNKSTPPDFCSDRFLTLNDRVRNDTLFFSSIYSMV